MSAETPAAPSADTRAPRPGSDERTPASRAMTGTQAISRAVLTLRLIARKGIEGARLADLTQLAGLPHPTVHRILKCLIEERLVVQNPETRRYQLGPMNYELGLATIHKTEFQRTFRKHLERLAAITGDTAYLSTRSGADFVCVDRVEGSYPIRALVLDIGGRRPLGFGAAGLTLLACLDDAEIAQLIAANASEIENHGRLTVDKIWRGIARTRSRGVALSKDASLIGTSSIGMAISNGIDLPQFAVSLVMVTDRLTPPRVRELHAILDAEIRAAVGRRAE